MSNPAETIVERNSTHGDFDRNADISQELKAVFAKGGITDPTFKEALDMIALKLSRILSGRADYFDHWKDIAGYAHLAEKHCAALDDDGIPF